MRVADWMCAGLIVWLATPAAAQVLPVDAIRSVRFDVPPRTDTGRGQERQPALRACPACPERHLWRPYLESIGLNILYNAGNHLRGHETANVGPSSWFANLKNGFEWDHNPFSVNQMGHPYQGSNYFTAGRANGLSFWESTGVAAFGSATWEFFFENNRASFNDLINTTLGGIALGEIMHRSAWLIRDTTTSGSARMWQEIFGTVIDPITGATRFVSGDAGRVVEMPAHFVPAVVVGQVSAGVLWQGSSGRSVEAARPFVNFDFRYGDITRDRSVVPYEAFTVAVTVGGGSAISETVARGRFYSRPFGEHDQYQFTVLQAFDYLVNRAYVFGGQGFLAEVAQRHEWGPATSIRLSATGGVSVLGAVDTLIDPPPAAGSPRDVFPDPDSRQYDYGPGFRWGGTAAFMRSGRFTANLSYDGYQIAVVDGFRSIHILQRANLDLRWWFTRAFALGAQADYFFRKAYYWVGANRTDQSPQFVLYMVWKSEK